MNVPLSYIWLVQPFNYGLQGGLICRSSCGRYCEFGSTKSAMGDFVNLSLLTLLKDCVMIWRGEFSTSASDVKPHSLKFLIFFRYMDMYHPLIYFILSWVRLTCGVQSSGESVKVLSLTGHDQYRDMSGLGMLWLFG